MDLTFIDTGAFIALSDLPDRHHREAEETYNSLRDLRSILVTTNHVVDETCTWLLRHTRSGHQAALRFGQLVERAAALTDSSELRTTAFSPNSLVVVYSTPAIERAAWDIFARYDTAGFSFTDCVSFAVMQSLGIMKAFTFDAHFDLMGFERL